MHDAATHSFLSQIPLIISPFLKIPQPVALPLNYAPLPRGLPPSSAALFNEVKAVVASVEEQQRLASEQQNRAKQKVSQWESDVLHQETMEQRRIAPGYLDSGVHILHPTHPGADTTGIAVPAYATPQPSQETSFYEPIAQHVTAASTTTSLPSYSSPAHNTPLSSQYGYRQQQPTSMHPYSSSIASSASSSTPSLNGYGAISSPQYAQAQHGPHLSLSQASSYRNEASTYQGQHTPTYEVSSYQHQSSVISQRSSPAVQQPPSVQVQPSLAPPARVGSPSPPGPPLPPKPPVEFVTRPLRISSMRKPLVSEFPWSSTASFAARTFAGTIGGISSMDSKYTIGPSSSSRTDTSSLYEGASFRRSSLPRLDSYRARDTAYNSLDTKLNEYLGSSNVNVNANDYKSPSYSTLQHTGYSLAPEKSSYDMLSGLNFSSPAEHESIGLIDFDEDLAQAQTPGPAAPSLAAPITNSFSVPGTITSSSSAVLTSNFPDYLSDDRFNSPANQSTAAPQSQVDLRASAGRFKISANYLDNDGDRPEDSNADHLYGQQEMQTATADNESDNDFSSLTQRQSAISHLAQAADIETPVDESEINYDASSVMEDNTAAETSETVRSAEEEREHDDAEIDEMLRKLQEEIDMEEKAAARAKKKARLKALEEAEAAKAADSMEAVEVAQVAEVSTHETAAGDAVAASEVVGGPEESEKSNAPTETLVGEDVTGAAKAADAAPTAEVPAEETAAEDLVEGTQQESAPSEIVAWTEESAKSDEPTDPPIGEDVAEAAHVGEGGQAAEVPTEETAAEDSVEGTQHESAPVEVVGRTEEEAKSHESTESPIGEDVAGAVEAAQAAEVGTEEAPVAEDSVEGTHQESALAEVVGRTEEEVKSDEPTETLVGEDVAEAVEAADAAPTAEVSTEESAAEDLVEGTQHESAAVEVVAWTEESAKSDEPTDPPIGESVAEAADVGEAGQAAEVPTEETAAENSVEGTQQESALAEVVGRTEEEAKSDEPTETLVGEDFAESADVADIADAAPTAEVPTEETAAEVPTEETAAENLVEGTQQESARIEVVGWTEESAKSNEPTDPPIGEDVAEAVEAADAAPTAEVTTEESAAEDLVEGTQHESVPAEFVGWTEESPKFDEPTDPPIGEDVAEAAKPADAVEASQAAQVSADETVAEDPVEGTQHENGWSEVVGRTEEEAKSHEATWSTDG
ncbi:hypothetical protein V1517DRAFT_181717 [Lipomyces orientalis]|uniref:Uncharacterized protein n=1 Tax=Lipomyces orientalis TaxID=1233043 RepID=A0ACC3TJR3_9ASCO